MGDWWDSITGLERFFWYITLPFSTVFLIRSALTFIGLGHDEDGDHVLELDHGEGDMEIEMDVDHDFDVDGDHGEIMEIDHDMEVEHGAVDHDHDDISAGDRMGFHILTFRNIIIFFTIFGWAGLTGIHFGFNPILTIAFAFVVAFVVILLVAAIFYNIYRLTESGTIHLRQTINSTGKVYLMIPPNQSGIGKINIQWEDTFREYDAKTEGEAIPTGAKVVVLDVIDGDTLLVEMIEED